MKKSIFRELVCTFLVLALLAAFIPSALAADPDDYWTDAGNYDISWYNSGDSVFYISTAAQLAGFAHLVNSDRTGFRNKTVYLTAPTDLSAHLWKPVGTGINLCFAGTFNGLGNAVSNMKVVTTQRYAGLFGYLPVNSSLKNLYILGCSVSGGLYAGGAAGFAAGADSAVIENCTVTGSVTGTGPTDISGGVGGIVGETSGKISGCVNSVAVTGGSKWTGGIAGYVGSGAVSNCLNTGTVNGDTDVGGIGGFFYGGSVSGCGNTGDVTGTGSNVGGIVGRAESNFSEFKSCYNSADIAGKSVVGGIAGSTTKPISYCYNTGSITATQTIAGGVAGASGDVSYCYNTGSVTVDGSDYSSNIPVGGVIGAADGDITACYNTGKAECTNGDSMMVQLGSIFGSSYNSTFKNSYGLTYGGADVTGAEYYGSDAAKKTISSGMDSLSSYTGITDNIFCNAPEVYGDGGTFSEQKSVNGGYPVLKSFGYTGSADAGLAQLERVDSTDVYIIRSAYQLDIAGNMAYNSQNVVSFRFATSSDGGFFGGVDLTGIDWTPGELCYDLDCGGSIVSGLRLDSQDGQNVGLFSVLRAELKGLTVAGSVSGGSKVGGIAGTVDGGSITDCVNMCSVAATGAGSGGLAGEVLTGSLTGCRNIGAVNGGDKTGGIAGALSGDSSAAGCNNYSEVRGANYVGGCVGSAARSGLTGCKNAGSVTSTGDYLGGIAGQAENTTLVFCENGGVIDAGGIYAGGVVGRLFAYTSVYKTAVENCANFSELKNGSSAAGGILGLAEAANAPIDVTCCVNTGKLGSALDDCRLGGIAGAINVAVGKASVSDCINFGSVVNEAYGAQKLGAIVGELGSGTVTNCFYLGTSGGIGQSGSPVGADIKGALPLMAFDKPVVNATVSETATLTTDPKAADVLAKCGLSAVPNVKFDDALTEVARGTAAVNTVMALGAGSSAVPVLAGSSVTALRRPVVENDGQWGFAGAPANIFTAQVSQPVAYIYTCELTDGVFRSAAPEGTVILAAKYESGDKLASLRTLGLANELYTLQNAAGSKIFILDAELAPLRDAIELA